MVSHCASFEHQLTLVHLQQVLTLFTLFYCFHAYILNIALSILRVRFRSLINYTSGVKNGTNYVAGTEYTFTVSTDNVLGIGMVTSYGVGSPSTSWSQDASPGRVLTKVITFTPPSSGDLSIHALCGGWGQTPMYLADPLQGTVIEGTSISKSVVSGGEMSKCDAISVCSNMGSSMDGTYCAGKGGQASACSFESQNCAKNCKHAEFGTGTSNAAANAGGADVSWGCVTKEEIKEGCKMESSATGRQAVPLTLLISCAGLVLSLI